MAEILPIFRWPKYFGGRNIGIAEFASRFHHVDIDMQPRQVGSGVHFGQGPEILLKRLLELAYFYRLQLRIGHRPSAVENCISSFMLGVCGQRAGLLSATPTYSLMPHCLRRPCSWFVAPPAAHRQVCHFELLSVVTTSPLSHQTLNSCLFVSEFHSTYHQHEHMTRVSALTITRVRAKTCSHAVMLWG